MATIAIEGMRNPSDSARPEGTPVLRLGFRPFYLLGAAFAAASVPLWIAHFYGWINLFGNVTVAWHAHEMVFGFANAIIIGFLYTAGRNWTGLWTPRGSALAGICAVWVAGRLAMLTAQPALAALVDLAFLPVAGYPFFRVLQRAGNKRNMFLVVLLGLLETCDAGYHAALSGWVDTNWLTWVESAILVIVVIEAAIGGRVIPMFTRNAVPGCAPVTNERRDRICLGFTAAASIALATGVPSALAAALSLAAAAAQATRLIGWKPLSSVRNPLLWVLHLSYAWIPCGFLLMGLSQLQAVPVSAALHVLAVGSIGGLILGMITRTALGHTGRVLKAGKSETAMYVLIQVGVVARFAAAMGVESLPSSTALQFATACWTAAFALYIAVYGRYLCTPRVDGREG